MPRTKPEPHIKHRTCFMCRKRKAKPLTATRGKNTYMGAIDVVLFCSKNCAANHALIRDAREIEQTHHFCQVSGKWDYDTDTDCPKCQGRAE